MIKLMTSFLFMLLVFSQFSEASYYCTEWTQKSSVTCIFASKDAKLFARQCENPCWSNGLGQGNWGAQCDKEEVCFFETPANFESECSYWVKVDGVTCQNPNTGLWESQWQRACKVGLREIWCSNSYPQ